MNASPALVCERLLFIILTVAIRPPFPFEKLGQRSVQLRIAFGECREVDRLDSAHVSEERQLIEVSAYGFLFLQYFVKSVDNDDILKEQKAIGRNLNQLTLLANMGRVEAVNLTALTKRYAELNATLTELLERKRWSDGNG